MAANEVKDGPPRRRVAPIVPWTPAPPTQDPASGPTRWTLPLGLVANLRHTMANWLQRSSPPPGQDVHGRSSTTPGTTRPRQHLSFWRRPTEFEEEAEKEDMGPKAGSSAGLASESQGPIHKPAVVILWEQSYNAEDVVLCVHALLKTDAADGVVAKKGRKNRERPVQPQSEPGEPNKEREADRESPGSNRAETTPHSTPAPTQPFFSHIYILDPLKRSLAPWSCPAQVSKVRYLEQVAALEGLAWAGPTFSPPGLHGALFLYPNLWFSPALDGPLLYALMDQCARASLAQLPQRDPAGQCCAYQLLPAPAWVAPRELRQRRVAVSRWHSSAPGKGPSASSLSHRDEEPQPQQQQQQQQQHQQQQQAQAPQEEVVAENPWWLLLTFPLIWLLATALQLVKPRRRPNPETPLAAEHPGVVHGRLATWIDRLYAAKSGMAGWILPMRQAYTWFYAAGVGSLTQGSAGAHHALPSTAQFIVWAGSARHGDPRLHVEDVWPPLARYQDTQGCGRGCRQHGAGGGGGDTRPHAGGNEEKDPQNKGEAEAGRSEEPGCTLNAGCCTCRCQSCSGIFACLGRGLRGVLYVLSGCHLCHGCFGLCSCCASRGKLTQTEALKLKDPALRIIPGHVQERLEFPFLGGPVVKLSGPRQDRARADSAPTAGLLASRRLVDRSGSALDMADQRTDAVSACSGLAWVTALLLTWLVLLAASERWVAFMLYATLFVGLQLVAMARYLPYPAALGRAPGTWQAIRVGTAAVLGTALSLLLYSTYTNELLAYRFL